MRASPSIDQEKSFPNASKTARTDFYVDGAYTESGAIENGCNYASLLDEIASTDKELELQHYLNIKFNEIVTALGNI